MCIWGFDAVQVEVASDGISIVTLQNSTGARCVEVIGGLTKDQLRWIYTSYRFDELLATGWDSSSITNSDNDETTHLWSELDARCDQIEIVIARPDPLSATFDYFLETILVDLDNGETFDANRPAGYYNSSDKHLIMNYTEANGAVIAFFGYGFYLEDIDLLYAIPIENDEGNYVPPTAETISDGTYNPFSRRLYMNLLNEATSLDNTRPFIQFAFSANGTALFENTGCVPIDETERQLVLSTLPGPGESIEVTPIAKQTTQASNPTTPTSTQLGTPTSDTYTRTHIALFITFFITAATISL